MNFSGSLVVVTQTVDTTTPEPEGRAAVALWETTAGIFCLLLLIAVCIVVVCGIFFSGFTAGWLTQCTWARGYSRTSRISPKVGISFVISQPAQKAMPKPREPQTMKMPGMKGSVTADTRRKAETGIATSSVTTGNNDNGRNFPSDLDRRSSQKHDRGTIGGGYGQGEER